MKKLLVLCLIAAASAFGSVQVTAADKEAPAEKGDKKAPKHTPFNGKIAAVDKTAKTLKVGERIFHVTATTKVIKAGKPATLDEATVGEAVGGAYLEGDGGRLDLISLRIGPKPEQAPKN